MGADETRYLEYSNDIFKKAYCVNLDSRPDRWDNVSKEFLKTEINPIRFSAVENKENPAEGCKQSHLNIIKEAYNKKENVLIFEDDVEFIDEALPYIKKVFDEINKVPWDMLFLGGNLLRPAFQMSEHLARLSHCYSTHAYGINKNLLEKIIPFLEANKNYPIDVLYGDYIIPVSECYISIPMIAIQADNYSDIIGKRIDYSIPIARYNKFIIKREF